MFTGVTYLVFVFHPSHFKIIKYFTPNGLWMGDIQHICSNTAGEYNMVLLCLVMDHFAFRSYIFKILCQRVFP